MPTRRYECGCTLGDARNDCGEMFALQLRMSGSISDSERIAYYSESHTAAELLDAQDEERAVRRLVRDHLRQQERDGRYADHP